MKSIHALSGNVANRHRFPWKHRKRNAISKGLNRTSTKCSSIFHVPCQTYPVNFMKTLLWRHNGHDCISNHQPHDCLRNHLFRYRSKKPSKTHITGQSPVNSIHKWPITRKMFPFDVVIMSIHVFVRNVTNRQTNWKCSRRLQTCQNLLSYCVIIADIIQVIKHMHSLIIISWLVFEL